MPYFFLDNKAQTSHCKLAFTYLQRKEERKGAVWEHWNRTGPLWMMNVDDRFPTMAVSQSLKRVFLRLIERLDIFCSPLIGLDLRTPKTLFGSPGGLSFRVKCMLWTPQVAACSHSNFIEFLLQLNERFNTWYIASGRCGPCFYSHGATAIRILVESFFPHWESNVIPLDPMGFLQSYRICVTSIRIPMNYFFPIVNQK